MSNDVCPNWQRHYGTTEPHYFRLQLEGEPEPRLVDVQELAAAAKTGKRAVHFEYVPLMGFQRSMLRFLAEATNEG